MRNLAIIAVAALLLAGCATHPQNVEPARIPISTAKVLETLDCDELRSELDRTRMEHDAFWNKQKGNRTRDGWLNALVIPGIGAATPDHEAELSQAKGMLLLLEREVAKRCQD